MEFIRTITAVTVVILQLIILMEEMTLKPDEYKVLVNAIDDKIYNLNTIINRSKHNKVWESQLTILYDIKKRLKKSE
jgi:hypothetical protein